MAPFFRKYSNAIKKFTKPKGEKKLIDNAQRRHLEWIKTSLSNNATNHALSLGLHPVTDAEQLIRQQLNKKIIKIVDAKYLTHINVALSC